jgi:glycosyltransferase involved in cell wall biosynthesis
VIELRTAPRCAYVVSRYPYVSHTFVLREVAALRERGLEIDTVTVRRPDPEDVIGPKALREQATTHAILPTGPWRLLRAHARAAWRGPRPYFATFREALGDAPGGARAALWQVFYFAEAILLWEHLDRRGTDHVHAHHANVAADLAMIATRFRNRLEGASTTWTFTLHGPRELDDPVGHNLALKAARADAVIAISDYARGRLRAIGAPSETRIEVIHCGVDIREYDRRPAQRDRTAALRLLTVARLEQRKGIETLLRAIARLAERETRVGLTIVGDGPDRDRLVSRAAELGVEGIVTMAGAVAEDEVTGFYGRADAFCLPSSAEGVPIVLMEAMASSLPVVATAIAGVRELVDDGVSGLVVPAGDEVALADSLQRLISEPELAHRLGESGRDAVALQFSLQGSAERIEALFVELAAASQP